MKLLGVLLIGTGFLAGALVAVQSADNAVRWGFFIPALAVSALGVVFARLSQGSGSSVRGALRQDEKALEASVQRIVDHLETLIAREVRWHPGEYHGWVDTHLRSDLEIFAANRRSLIAGRGLSGYAAVMSEFAAGERYVNRVWSASVDGYIDEVRNYLARALHQFQRTQALLRGSNPDVDGR